MATCELSAGELHYSSVVDAGGTLTPERLTADLAEHCGQAIVVGCVTPSNDDSPTPVDSKPRRVTGRREASRVRTFNTPTRRSDKPAATGLSLRDGQRLLDRYEILRRIGQGGMSCVYEAVDEVRNERVAIKVLLPHLAADERLRERFLQEGRLSSKFAHPNIARVYDLHQADGLIFLSMELLQGCTLRQDMLHRRSARQTYSPAEVLNVLEAVTHALSVVHRARVIHRDLKPENVWLTTDGGLKVIDFGIARDRVAGAHTVGGQGSGTPFYGAPEQFAGSPSLDHRADQYAAAVIAYELLTGELPQGATEPPHLKVASIPRRLSTAIYRGMSTDPSRRFATMDHFLAAARTRRSRLPLLASLAAIGCLTALAGGSYAYQTLDESMSRFGIPSVAPAAVSPQIPQEPVKAIEVDHESFAVATAPSIEIETADASEATDNDATVDASGSWILDAAAAAWGLAAEIDLSASREEAIEEVVIEEAAVEVEVAEEAAAEEAVVEAAVVEAAVVEEAVVESLMLDDQPSETQESVEEPAVCPTAAAAEMPPSPVVEVADEEEEWVLAAESTPASNLASTETHVAAQYVQPQVIQPPHSQAQASPARSYNPAYQPNRGTWPQHHQPVAVQQGSSHHGGRVGSHSAQRGNHPLLRHAVNHLRGSSRGR